MLSSIREVGRERKRQSKQEHVGRGGSGAVILHENMRRTRQNLCKVFCKGSTVASGETRAWEESLHLTRTYSVFHTRSLSLLSSSSSFSTTATATMVDCPW